VILTNFFI